MSNPRWREVGLVGLAGLVTWGLVEGALASSKRIDWRRYPTELRLLVERAQPQEQRRAPRELLGDIIPIGMRGSSEFAPTIAYNTAADEFLVGWVDPELNAVLGAIVRRDGSIRLGPAALTDAAATSGTVVDVKVIYLSASNQYWCLYAVQPLQTREIVNLKRRRIDADLVPIDGVGIAATPHLGDAPIEDVRFDACTKSNGIFLGAIQKNAAGAPRAYISEWNLNGSQVGGETQIGQFGVDVRHIAIDCSNLDLFAALTSQNQVHIVVKPGSAAFFNYFEVGAPNASYPTIGLNQSNSILGYLSGTAGAIRSFAGNSQTGATINLSNASGLNLVLDNNTNQAICTYNSGGTWIRGDVLNVTNNLPVFSDMIIGDPFNLGSYAAPDSTVDLNGRAAPAIPIVVRGFEAGVRGANDGDIYFRNFSPDPLLSSAPSMRVTMDQAVYGSGDTIDLIVTFGRGSEPAQADAYIALQLADGSFLEAPGFVGSTVQQYRSNFAVVDEVDPGLHLHDIPAGVLPPGGYTWFWALAEPGTFNFIGGVRSLSFSIL